jgi:hypothetical protein
MSNALALANTTAHSLVTADGKDRGTRYSFVGQSTASGLRAEGKDKGLKGKELTAWVNAHLTGDTANVAKMKGAMFLESCSQAGLVPVYGDVNAKGSTATLKFQKASTSTLTAADARAAAAEARVAELEKAINELRAANGLAVA